MPNTNLSKGTVLKSWEIVEKLGAGACSDVYLVKDTKGRNSATFYAMKVSEVPPQQNKKKNVKKKKTPEQRSADALYSEHLLYQNSLKGHRGIASLPDLNAYGEENGHRFLVMQRLGRNLEQIKKQHGALAETVVAQLGLEMLDIFQHLHSKKIVYVDVKPENFMLDLEQEKQIYCVDFGISERYIMVTGKHKEFKNAGIVGTPTFLSLNCHEGATCSRRDDIEALLYVLLYLIRGNLPWQNASNDSEGCLLKKNTKLEDLCDPFSDEWVNMLKSVRSLKFEDEPDYSLFRSSLKKICGNIPSKPTPYNWKASAPTNKRGASSSPPAKKMRKSSSVIETETEAKPAALNRRKAPAKKSSVSKKSSIKNTTEEESAKPTKKKPQPRRRKNEPSEEEKDEVQEKPIKKKPQSKRKKAEVVVELPAEESDDEEEQEDGVVFVKQIDQNGLTNSGRKRKRDRAVQKAVNAAAAASAAAKEAVSTRASRLSQRNLRKTQTSK